MKETEGGWGEELFPCTGQFAGPGIFNRRIAISSRWCRHASASPLTTRVLFEHHVLALAGHKALGREKLHPGRFSSHTSLFGTGSSRDIETTEMT